MKSREPVVAGQFYPAGREACLAEIRECLESMTVPEPLPGSVVGGIVPHAGWTFSGALAALVFSAIRQRHEAVGTFVIFGAAHSYLGSKPAADSHESWETPLGIAPLDGRLRDALLDKKVIVSDASAHRYEHSIEVQVPFVQHLFPDARILPLIVPPHEAAIALGEAAAETALESGENVVYIGSTDLTHYGPRYGFTPMGPGGRGLQWASEVNDRAFIDLALAVEPEALLSGAIEKGNACGPGAASATVAAARKLGLTRGHLLAYTNSYDVMLDKMGVTSSDSVGYAAMLF